MTHVDPAAIARGESVGAHPAMAPEARVPARALVLSVLSLAVPVVATLGFPGWGTEDVGLLVWLTALVPAFLLTYHRGWQGTSLALAAGMAALTVAQVSLPLVGLSMPPWEYSFIGVVMYLGVCLGAGISAEVLRRARDEAVRMALTDDLTSLGNRRHASLVLRSGFAAAKRGHPLTAVLFDLDHLKAYNDTAGHVAGDRLLESFARTLEAHTRAMNHSARIGGDEFLTLLSNSRLEGAEIFVGRVLDAFHDECRQAGLPVTVSAGVAEFDLGMATPEDLIHDADRALSRAKAAGGGCYRTASRFPVIPRETSGEAQSSSVASSEGEVGGLREEDARDDPPWPRGEELIFLLESDLSVQNARRASLEQLGYRVMAYADGATALDGLTHHTPDLLVVTDALEDMSGLVVAARAEPLIDDLRVVYLTVLSDQEALWKGAPGRVTGVLSTPFRSRDLAQKIRSVLDAPNPSRPTHSLHPGPS